MTQPKYFISINNTTTNEVSCTEVLVVHNGTDAFVTEYNTLITNAETTPLATFTADIDSGNVRIRMVPISADSVTYKFTKTLIEV